METIRQNENQETGGGAWKQVLGLMLFALLVLAMLQSAALVTSTYDLPSNNWTIPLIQAAETWHGWMETTGFAGLTETIAEEVEVLHSMPVTEEAF